MESPKSRAAKLLREKQSSRRKATVFFGLALLAILCTTAVLLLHAQAMNHTRRVLECACVPHQHTDECYPDGDRSAQPVCGLAEAVVHVHNEDCYDAEGELVCPLEELEPHTHDESCWVERRELICGLDGVDEADLPDASSASDASSVAVMPSASDASSASVAPSAGHTHTESCYAPGERALICGQEERAPHTHTDACYTQEPPVLSCGQEEGEAHTHTDACYTQAAPVLSCGQEEGEGHAHTDACYADGAPVLVCGLEEGAPDAASGSAPTDAPAGEGEPRHVHTEECYRVYTELGCGKLELHTHTEDCYRTVEPENSGELPYQVLVCTVPQLEEHIHSEECFTTVELTPEEVAALEQQGTEIVDLKLVYEDADVRVTVDYDTTALIPEGASLSLVDAAAPMPAPTPIRVPDAIAPDASAPDAADPDTAQPDAIAPDASAPDAADPDTAQPDAIAPDASAPDAIDPDPAQPDAIAPDASAPDAGADGNGDAADPADNAPEAPDDSGDPANAGSPEEPNDVENPDNSDNVGDPAENAEGAPSETAPSVSASGENTDSGLVRAGFMAEGREWLPASTVIYTVQYLENGAPLGEPTEYAYTPGGELPVFPRAIARHIRECRTDDFIVTAAYTALAQIPEEAELRAALVTDETVVAEHESEYRAALNSDQAQMVSLMDIGFWLNGEEIQPAAPVTITVQLLGEDGLPVGEPLTVVHFSEAGAEVLHTNVDESGAATFPMTGFSLVGLGYTPEADEQGRVTLDHTFEWTDENGMFHMTFRIKGVAGPYGLADASDTDAPDTDAPDTDKPDADAPDTDADEPNDGGDADGAREPEEEAVNAPLANDTYLEFSVETLGEDDAAYAAYAEYSTGSMDADALLNLAVLRYALTYSGEKLDLSNCEIEVTIEPTERMELVAAAYQRENTAENGDDDGDGYVLAADGETLLPAPILDTSVRLSALAPVAGVPDTDAFRTDGSGTDTSGADVPGTDVSGAPQGPLLAEQGAVSLGGREYAERLEETGVGSMDVDALQDGTNAPGTGEPELDAAGTGVSGADASAESGAVRGNQAVTFSIPANAAQTPETENTLGAELTLSVNPQYTVQYYARLPKADLKDSSATGTDEGARLSVIDTRGKGLPKNGGGRYNDKGTASQRVKLSYIPVDTQGEVITTPQPTMAYRTKTFYYRNAPELIYTDMLISNEHYKPDELWVLKQGCDPTSVDPKDWVIYSQFEFKTDIYDKVELVTPEGVYYRRYRYYAYDASKKQVELSFTNNPRTPDDYTPYQVVDPSHPQGGVTYIPLRTPANSEDPGTVIRWVYKANTSDFTADAAFHDYDISSGYKTDANGNIIMDTKDAGINAATRTNNNAAKFAFGNGNAGTVYGDMTWKDSTGFTNNINRLNSVGTEGKGSYEGCAFGLVNGINSDGSNVTFSNGISAPENLFGSGTATGKQSYTGNLTFTQDGDTYTLSSAQVNGAAAISNLEKFSNPSVYDGVKNKNAGKYHDTVIWTNHFWVMDQKQNTDYHFGKGTETGKPELGNMKIAYGEKVYFNPTIDDKYRMPTSDNAVPHNSYFGMQFQVDFELTDNYVGPLDYLFYGDDDLWVFLSEVQGEGEAATITNTKLICDIGGVHRSVGEYTNLWEYIDGGQEGSRTTKKYRLSVFYTERGASGSTCWMQFTLPNVTSSEVPEATPNNYGSLEIGKEVFRAFDDGRPDSKLNVESYDNGEVFQFVLKIEKDGTTNGAGVPDRFKYSLYEDDKSNTPTKTDIVAFNESLIQLGHKQRIVIEDLPVGAKYTITEIDAPPEDVQTHYTYDTKISNALKNEGNGTWEQDMSGLSAYVGSSSDSEKVPGKEITGTIEPKKKQVVKFENTYHVYNLPKTGGITVEWYVLGGGALVLVMALALRARRKRSRAAPRASL